MEKIDDRSAAFSEDRNHEFAWFSKIKMSWASYFSKTSTFFLFLKKKTFFMKIAWFCQKYNARIVYIFWSKKQKQTFRSTICPKNSIFFAKITQIQEHFRENQAHSKHGRMWTFFFSFFSFFSFFEKWSIVKGFSG